MAARPLGPPGVGPSGAITVFQNKLEVIVRDRGILWVAGQTDLPTSTIGNWRAGCSPSLDAVQQLARGLNIPVRYFADDDEPIREFTHITPDTDDEGHGIVGEGTKGYLAAEQAGGYGRPARRRR